MTTTLRTFKLTFFVPGQPIAQGSKEFKGIYNGHGVMVESAKQLGPWRERIALAAHNFSIENNGLELPVANRPIGAHLKFVMPRPVSTPKTRTPPAIKRPDIDKVARSVLDALTGIIFSDDSAVVHLEAHKRLAELNETPGVHITIEALPT